LVRLLLELNAPVLAPSHVPHTASMAPCFTPFNLLSLTSASRSHGRSRALDPCVVTRSCVGSGSHSQGAYDCHLISMPRHDLLHGTARPDCLFLHWGGVTWGRRHAVPYLMGVWDETCCLGPSFVGNLWESVDKRNTSKARRLA